MSRSNPLSGFRAPRRAAGACLIALACANGLTLAPAHAEQASLATGVYSKAQAKAGEDLYDTHCGTCHEPEYFVGVFRAWSGESVRELFNVMAATMPQSNPGSLMDREYLDVLAYILEENDFPRGEEPLTGHGRQLDEIMVVSP